MSTKRPRAVDVEWVDSSSESGWRTDPQPQRDMLCYTRGWLIAESAESILVSAHCTVSRDGGPVDQFHSSMTIPRAAIRRLRKRKG